MANKTPSPPLKDNRKYFTESDKKTHKLISIKAESKPKPITSHFITHAHAPTLIKKKAQTRKNKSAIADRSSRTNKTDMRNAHKNLLITINKTTIGVSSTK